MAHRSLHAGAFRNGEASRATTQGRDRLVSRYQNIILLPVDRQAALGFARQTGRHVPSWARHQSRLSHAWKKNKPLIRRDLWSIPATSCQLGFDRGIPGSLVGFSGSLVEIGRRPWVRSSIRRVRSQVFRPK